MREIRRLGNDDPSAGSGPLEVRRGNRGNGRRRPPAASLRPLVLGDRKQVANRQPRQFPPLSSTAHPALRPLPRRPLLLDLLASAAYFLGARPAIQGVIVSPHASPPRQRMTVHGMTPISRHGAT